MNIYIAVKQNPTADKESDLYKTSFKSNDECKPVLVQFFVDIELSNRKMSIEMMDMVLE